MTLTMRRYHGLDDLDRIRTLLTAAWNHWGPYTRLHCGDLNWRMRDAEYAENLWIAEDDGGDLVGFVQAEDGMEFEFQLHPSGAGVVESEALAWCEQMAQASPPGENKTRQVRQWVADGLTNLIVLLEKRGYARMDGHFNLHCRSLDAPIEPPDLPSGYHVRSITGPEEVEKRVQAHRAGWQSEKMTVEKYLRMRSLPDYCQALDLVVVAPDGTFAACCNGWVNPDGKAALFEPVATHPDYRRKGLGKAMITFGLGHMREMGATAAFVASLSSNPPSTRLYESCGMDIIHTDLRYQRTL